MQGLVYTTLADMVERNYGLARLQTILDKANLEDDAFVATATYPDTDMHKLLAAASEELDASVETLLKSFGEFMFASLTEKHEALILEFDDLKAFLLKIDSFIHVEVSKLYPNSRLPVFDYEDHHADRLTMIYQSPRRMCFLAEGLIAGAASYFQQSYRLEHSRCMHNGDNCCYLEISFD